MNASAKKTAIFFSVLAAFVIILVTGANFLLKKVPSEAGGPEKLAPLAPVEIPSPAAKDNTSGTSIISDIKTSNPEIIYKDDEFKPAEITIKASDPIGCLIVVTNKTNQIIRIGLSPHKESGDPGANYGTLAPGEQGIYDVRYPGLIDAGVHNHLKPGRELKVIYGEGCL